MRMWAAVDSKNNCPAKETLQLKEGGNKNVEPYFLYYLLQRSALALFILPLFLPLYQHPEMSLVLLRRWKRVSAGSKPCSWAPNRAQPGVLAV